LLHCLLQAGNNAACRAYPITHLPTSFQRSDVK
jgi:hypothetical protein